MMENLTMDNKSRCGIIRPGLASDGNEENAVLKGFINCTAKGRYREKDVFVKMNQNDQAEQMFAGEKKSLEALSATGCIRVPQPLKVRWCKKHGAELVLEQLQLNPDRSRPLPTESQAELGYRLALEVVKVITVMGSAHYDFSALHMAQLHLDNSKKVQQTEPAAKRLRSGPRGTVERFGFYCPTSCGYILNDNQWNADWPIFYRRRLQHRIDLYLADNTDPELKLLWNKVRRIIPKLFTDIKVYPSLLHGDLWPGNAAVTTDGQVVMYDPAAFYGHHEFDLALSNLVEKFDPVFYEAYHTIIPQNRDVHFLRREKLYQFYYFLNQYTHRQYYRHEPHFMDQRKGVEMLQYILDVR